MHRLDMIGPMGLTTKERDRAIEVRAEATPAGANPVVRVNVGVPERELLKLEEHQLYPKGSLKRYSPVGKGERGLITESTRIASVGSCFARELKKWLVANGYTYVQVEEGPGSDQGSARFGPVYNTACLKQIFESALGSFEPVDRLWAHKGRLLDPYRKDVAWPDEDAAASERRDHAEAVREMVKSSDVLVCTMGLAEVWRSKIDGSTFFQVPPSSVFDPNRHEYALTSVEENVQNLERFYELLRGANPQLRLVVTLSPVPLRATFRDMSCVSANTVSKAILRVAIDEFCRSHPEVIYFPAYEIVQHLEPKPFLKDNRHVKPKVVDRIMRTFIESYG